MNRIYRRVWSTALQCWVVASELASVRGKRTSAARGAAAALLLALPIAAMATEGIEQTQLKWWQLYSLLAPHSELPEAVPGVGLLAGQSSGIAVPRYRSSYATWTETYGDDSMALGPSSVAVGHRSMAFGIDTHAKERGVALGFRARAEETHSTAIGYNAQGWGVGSIALGNASFAASRNSIALGSGALSQNENSVALGADSNTYSNNQVSVGNGGLRRKIVYVADGAVNASSSEVVTGRQLFATEQKIQRNALLMATGTTMTESNKARASAADALAAGVGAAATGNNSLAFGKASAAAGRQSIALGEGAKASQWSSFALGADSHSQAEGAIAFGYQAKVTGATSMFSVALGERATATHANAVALGAGSTTTGTNQVSVGSGSVKRRIVNVADGTLSASSTDAVTGKQLNQTNANVSVARNAAAAAQTAANAAKSTADGAVARSAALEGLIGQVSGTGDVRVGGQNSGTVLDVRNKSSINRKISGLADATLSASSTEAVTGRQLQATNTSVTAAQSTAATAQATATAAHRAADGLVARATALEGLISQASPSGNVRLGGQNTGTILDVRSKSNAVRKLSGVADGALGATSTEAVTGKQLNATNTNVSAAQNAASTAHTAATAAQRTADGVVTRATALEGLVSQVAATGDLRLGVQNTGTVLDVRNKSNAARKLSGVADGTLSAASTEAVTGKQLNATNTNVTAAQNTATTAQAAATAAQRAADGVVTRATALEGLVSQVSASGSLRLGAQNTGTTLDLRNKSNAARKLSGVADGALSATSTDAVTGKQLFGTQQKVTAHEGTLATHSSQLSGQDGRITDNRRDLDELRTEFENFDPDLDGVVKFAADGSIAMNGGRVRGLAAGDASSAASTDAVNGGQLFATNHRVSLMESAGRFVAVDFDEESSSAKAGEFSVAIGDSAEAGEGTNGATAVGAYARARARGSVALGRAAFVDGAADNGFALGTGSTVLSKSGTALGGYSRVEIGAENSVALGGDSTATEENVVSVGNLTKKRRIVNVARGRDAEDTSTIAQLDESLALLGGNAGVDVNGNIISPTYNLQGGTQNTVADALAVLDGAVTTTGTRVDRVENQLRSVFQTSPATGSDGVNQLNLAGLNGMVLGNVANGLIAPGSRDAVNGGQLHAMEQRLDGRIDGLEQRVDTRPQGRAMAIASAPTPRVAAEEEGSGAASGTPAAASGADGGGRIASADDGGKPAKADAPAPAPTPTPTPQVSTADLEKMLARANEYADDAIKGVEQRLDKMDKRFNRLAAMNSAQSAMAMNTAGLATYNRLGAGVGYSDGESAMAVGYQRVLNDKGSATFSLNGAFTNSGEQSVGLGVGIGW